VTLSDRDKRALLLLGGAAVIAFVYWMATRSPSATASVATPADSIERSERRLTALRASLATVDGKEALLRQASSELAGREKGLIPGDTSNQAQAQLLQIVGRIAQQQAPPIQIRQAEFAQPRSYGDAYGVVSVSVTIECRTDELINLLAGLSQQPELISTEDIRFGTANVKSKSMLTRITIAGLVPRKLVPEKKGLSSF
jgi:hypothetical protein